VLRRRPEGFCETQQERSTSSVVMSAFFDPPDFTWSLGEELEDVLLAN
jgi:hypothetical protein